MQIKSLQSYSVADVALWLNIIGLGDKASAFQENAVDGDMLLSLTHEDMVGDLGLSNLQAKKLERALDFTKSVEKELSQEGGEGKDSDHVKELETQLEELKKQNEELKSKLASKEKAAPQSPQQAQPSSTVVQGQPVYVVEERHRFRRHRLL